MTELAQPLETANATIERERLLRLLALATFIIFFQGYMVAPIIPLLSTVLHAPEEAAGLIVPAYLIPYGISALIYGPIADRIGIQRVMFASVAAFSVLTMLTATAQSVGQLTLFRIITGIAASGVVPLALALVGRLYPYEQRGRALGWLFGAMAGGMAFGSPLGAMLVPLIGWRGLFLTVGAAAIVLLQAPLRTDAEAVADQQHSDHQLGGDRGAPDRAIEGRKLPPQPIEFNEPVDRSQ